MIINQATLGEVCTRVAAGDEQARRDFDQHVPPLVEIVVSRWLRQQEREARSGSSAHRVRRMTGAVCARMIANAQPVGETLVARRQGLTLNRPR